MSLESRRTRFARDHRRLYVDEIDSPLLHTSGTPPMCKLARSGVGYGLITPGAARGVHKSGPFRLLALNPS